MSARRVGPRLRRTWPQRLLILFNVGCIVAALGSATVIGYANKRASEIPRVRIGDDALASSGSLANGKAQNFLIVGADSDEGDDPNAVESQGRDSVEGLRSDTIMILRIDPKNTGASILSLPRDLWVDIPGASSQKINAAMNIGLTRDPNGGGAKLLIQTIKQNFGIDISHYVQINFAGFKGLVDALGGVKVWFDTPVRDFNSGLFVGKAGDSAPGCFPLDGTQALAFARSRHYQAWIDGRWKHDPQSDLSRIQRQQDFVRKVITKAISRGIRNPYKLKEFVDLGVKNVTLDDTLTIDDLLGVGQRYRSFNPDTLKTYNLDVTDAAHGGQAALDLLDTPHNDEVLRLFQTADDGDDSGLTPSLVQLVVSNGSGVSNQATQVTQSLRQAGFRVNNPAVDSYSAQTTVKYPEGQLAQARYVARYLQGPAVLEPSSDVAIITLNTGPDFAGVRTDPKPASEVSVPAGAETTTTSSTTPLDTSASTTTPTGGGSDTTTTTVSPFIPQTPPGQSCN